MGTIEVTGKNPLHGEIRIQGSKNAALPILAATILNKGITVLHNCPRIKDVTYMISILESIGCKARWDENILILNSTWISSYDIPVKYGSKMRSSIVLLGSLLGRMKKAEASYPGGCVIGKRPIDLHIKALRTMNVDIREEDERFICTTEELRGSVVSFDKPSVGATENVIMAAVMAKGTTRIIHGAKEPEISELCKFLRAMGARVKGEGTDEIIIEGVEELHDAEYTIVSDRIVAGTYILGAMATKGNITIRDFPSIQLSYFLNMIKEMGVFWEADENEIRIIQTENLKPVSYIETSPYPGFPTDLQSQLMAVLTIIPGISFVRETIFEERFKVAVQLEKLGAGIHIQENLAVIKGSPGLSGGEVYAQELRGGAALVIAGLIADGKTVIYDSEYIERGYEDICRDFSLLGADIKYREIR